MAGQEHKDAVGRSEQIRQLERAGTGILGAGIIIMMISVPLLLTVLLIYLWIKF